jgi:hypothetical protein
MCAKLVKAARTTAVLAALAGSLVLAGSVDTHPYHHHRGQYCYFD